MIDYKNATAAEIINDCKRRAGEYVSKHEWDDLDEKRICERSYECGALQSAITELVKHRIVYKTYP